MIPAGGRCPRWYDTYMRIPHISVMNSMAAIVPQKTFVRLEFQEFGADTLLLCSSLLVASCRPKKICLQILHFNF